MTGRKMFRSTHIDGDPNNNTLANLCVVCLDCHSRLTGRRGLGKQFSPLEVRLYKHEWERQSRRLTGLPFGRRPKLPKLERELFVFHSKRIIHELFVTPDSYRPQIDRGFELLQNLSLFEGVTKEVLSKLHQVYVICAIGDRYKPLALARSLSFFSQQFINPKYVKLDKADEANLLKQIDVAAALNTWSIEGENRRAELIGAIIGSVEDLLPIAMEYKRVAIFRAAMRELRGLQRDTSIVHYKGDRLYPKLTRRIEESVTTTIRELHRQKLRWQVPARLH
jgi:hypothetical protein